MRPVFFLPVGCLMAAVVLPPDADLSAQTRGFDFTYGRWWWGGGGVAAEAYSFTYRRPLFGPFSYGIGLSHLDDKSATPDRTQTGGEFSIGLGNDGKGPYALGSGGLAMRHTDGSTDAAWAAGVGYAVRPLSFLSVGAEATYRVEKDEWQRAFWRFDPIVDRRGWQVRAKMAIHLGGGRARRFVGRSGRAGETDFKPPSRSDINRIARSGGASSSAARTAANVVQTAIDVMGTP